MQFNYMNTQPVIEPATSLLVNRMILQPTEPSTLLPEHHDEKVH